MCFVRQFFLLRFLFSLADWNENDSANPTQYTRYCFFTWNERGRNEKVKKSMWNVRDESNMQRKEKCQTEFPIIRVVKNLSSFKSWSFFLWTGSRNRRRTRSAYFVLLSSSSSFYIFFIFNAVRVNQMTTLWQKCFPQSLFPSSAKVTDKDDDDDDV